MHCAVAAVFIAPPVESTPAPEQALAALFDLTPTEAKVLFEIASGKPLADAAEALGVATHGKIAPQADLGEVRSQR
jgi:hypothetical protein